MSSWPLRNRRLCRPGSVQCFRLVPHLQTREFRIICITFLFLCLVSVSLNILAHRQSVEDRVTAEAMLSEWLPCWAKMLSFRRAHASGCSNTGTPLCISVWFFCHRAGPPHPARAIALCGAATAVTHRLLRNFTKSDGVPMPPYQWLQTFQICRLLQIQRLKGGHESVLVEASRDAAQGRGVQDAKHPCMKCYCC